MHIAAGIEAADKPRLGADVTRAARDGLEFPLQVGQKPQKVRVVDLLAAPARKQSGVRGNDVGVMPGQKHQHLEFCFVQPELVPPDQHPVRAKIDAKITDRDDALIVIRR